MQLRHNQPLHEYSTFRIGGVARYFTVVCSVEELGEALAFCRENQLRFHVVGKGSNSLFDDRGFDGLVILNKVSFLNVEQASISVGGGYSFSLLGVQTAKQGLTGLEFASGIPGTVGGAIFMNAGANGKETADCLTEVTFLHASGLEERLHRKELAFSYRYSPFHEMDGVIVAARFSLTRDPLARKRQLESLSYRMGTQPYKAHSCGCVFRNLGQETAGSLIERCGLKGKQIGGAQVSTVHANFIINRSDATARDVWELAQSVRERVKAQTGIELEMELRRIPYRP